MDSRPDFHDAREQLRQQIGLLAGMLDHALPPGQPPDPDATGQSWEHPLKPLAGQIDNVLASFDQLQLALGLPPGREPRHRAFLEGKLARR